MPGIYLRNGATGDLELASAAGLSEEFQKNVSHAAAGSDGWTLVNQETPVYCSLQEEMNWPCREAFVAEGIRSVAVVPILYKGGIIFCFNSGARGVDTIPASSRSTLELIGAQLGHIVARLQAEEGRRSDLQRLKHIEEVLEARTRSLEEMNAALKVLLAGRERDKHEVEEKVLSNVEQLIQPYLRKLKASTVDFTQRAWIDIVEANLRQITSPFLKNTLAFNFTPKELEVIQFMKEGRTTKEIAGLLHVCPGAIDIHRHHIRKKLGLNNKKVNLQAYLFSMV